MLQCGISFQWEIRGGQLNRPIYMWKSSLAAATIRHWASTALLLTWNFNEFENKGDFKFKVTLWSVWAAVFPCSFEDAHWNYCIAVPCLDSRLSVFWDRWSSQKSKISMQRSSSGLRLHCGGYQCANKIGFGSVWNGGLPSFRFQRLISSVSFSSL